MLDFIGLYKRELTAFFANTVAATQATTVASGRQLHYLRTTNPFNPENLAVYPRRLGTNRPNAYTEPGAFDKLPAGLRVLRDAPVRPAAPDAHQHAVADRRRRRCRSCRCR